MYYVPVVYCLEHDMVSSNNVCICTPNLPITSQQFLLQYKIYVDLRLLYTEIGEIIYILSQSLLYCCFFKKKVFSLPLSKRPQTSLSRNILESCTLPGHLATTSDTRKLASQIIWKKTHHNTIFRKQLCM